MLKLPHLFSGDHEMVQKRPKPQKCPKMPKNAQKPQNPPKPGVSWGFRENPKNAKIELGLLWDQNCPKPQKTHFLRGLAGPPKIPQKRPKIPKTDSDHPNFDPLLTPCPIDPCTLILFSIK